MRDNFDTLIADIQDIPIPRQHLVQIGIETYISDLMADLNLATGGRPAYAALPLEQNNALSHLVKMYCARFSLEMPEKQCDENGRYFFNLRVYED